MVLLWFARICPTRCYSRESRDEVHTDKKTTVARFGIDDNYASTKCSDIDRYTKVRSRLDVSGDSDKVSVWFTRTGFAYSTPTMSCWWGCRATHDTARR